MTHPNTIAMRQSIVREDLRALDVRPSAPGPFSSSSLGAWLPTPEAWDAGRPRMIGLHLARMIEENAGILRIYGEQSANLARRTESIGRLTGWVRARQPVTAEPIEAATVIEVAEVPVRFGGRTLPILRLMEHGNPNERFVMSLPDLAHYVQKDRAEITVT
jgi:hypothetical protein